MEASNFKGYSLFNGVDNAMLRAYNRLNTLVTISEDAGEGLATRYLESLGDVGKKEVAVMAQWIKREGRETVSRKVKEYE